MNIATVARDRAELPPGHLVGAPSKHRPAPAKGRVFGAAAPSGMTLNYEGARAVRQRQKSWSGVSASIARMHCDGELYVDLGSEAARLSVVLEEVGGRIEIRSNNCRSQLPADDGARPLSIIPASLQAHGKADGVRFVRHLVVEFETAALRRLAADEIDANDVFAPRLMFADPGIMRLAQLLADECVDDAPHSRLYGDTLSMTLLLALSRVSATSRPPTSTHGHLAPWQLRRVSEYLNAHMAEDVQLHVLSGLVNLSRSYFSRAFKISTGLAPHQWLLHARIAKAKQLMLVGDHPLAQIAVDVGFADQAHFTRTFGRAVGESPGSWRRNRAAGR
jgi:AraC family transcriptional regulator